MPHHHTHNLCVQGRETTVHRRAVALVRGHGRARWCHARGGGRACRLLSLRSRPHLTHGGTSSHKINQLALVPSWKVPPVSSGHPQRPLQARRCPAGADTEPCRYTPLGVTLEGRGWGLGGRGGGRRSRWAGQVPRCHLAGRGEQEWLRRHPLLQAKLQRRDKPVFLCRHPDVGPLRTDSRCWGRTAAAGRWRGRSWHL